MEKVKAVRGSSERDSEVRKWLKDQGAKTSKYPCTNPNYLYFVTLDGRVEYLSADSVYAFLLEECKLPRWRADVNKTYLYIDDEMGIYEDSDHRGSVSDNRYKNGNYFRTREEAEKMRDKIIKLLKSRSNE